MASLPTPVTDLGFRLVSKRACVGGLESGTAVGIPGRPGLNLRLESAADPRAIPPAGMFPSQGWRYRAYIEVLPEGTSTDLVRNISSTAAALTRGLPLLFLDVTLQNSFAVFAVTGFRAVDVFDLDRSRFEITRDGIKVQHNIYKVIHAGTERLIPEDDDKGLLYWSNVGPYMRANLSRGTTVNPTAPWDVREYRRQMPNDQLFADTSSNVIRVNNPGAVNFVSYVGVAEPFFREVVVLRGSSKQEVAAAIGTAWDIAERQATSSVTPYVLRYAWSEIAQQWVLSESFNYKPSSVAAAPVGIQQGPQDLSTHYVYDMRDPDFPEVRGIGPGQTSILKRAYPVWVARDKADPESKNYDPEFETSVLPQEFGAEVTPGDPSDLSRILLPNSAEFFPNGGLLGAMTGEATTCDLSTFSFTSNHSFVYTSPKFDMPVSGTYRLGSEYYASYLHGKFQAAFEGAIFVRSDAVENVSVHYDPASDMAWILRAGGDNVQERVVQGVGWSRCFEVPEAMGTGKFLLGEFPYRTDGGSALEPPIEREDIAQDGEIDLPDGKLPYRLGLQVKKGKNGRNLPASQSTFRLLLKDAELADLELTLHDIAPDEDGTIAVTVPPKRFAEYKTGGGFFGIKWADLAEENAVKREKLAPPPGNPRDKGPWVLPSDNQIELTPELTWPLRGSNVTSAFDEARGTGYMAYQIAGRIDLGIRPPDQETYTIIRDAVLRMSPVETEGDVALPDATMPRLVYDDSWRGLFLFYIYKGSIVVKNIPLSLMDEIDREGGTLSLEAESIAIRKLHQLLPWVVYDKNRLSAEIIEEDIEQNLVLLRGEASLGEEADKTSIDSYSVLSDTRGRIYCFLQESGRISVLRSTDGAETWVSVFDGDLYVYSPDEEDKTEEATYPYVMYDSASGKISLFFFVAKSLMMLQFSISLMEQEPEDALRAFGELRPSLIFGELTEEMQERGILKARIETIGGTGDSGDEDQEQEEALPGGIGGLVAKQGNYRIFFIDSLNNLRSLISTNSGETWRLDENFSREDGA